MTSAVSKAKKLYADFSGHDGEIYARMPAKSVKGVLAGNKTHVLITIGYLDGVLYETVRDGRREKYKHMFAKSARPLLATSHDGRSLYILDGDYRFTERGIVDRVRKRSK